MLSFRFLLIKTLFVLKIINIYSEETDVNNYNKNLEYETTTSNKVVKKISRFFDIFYSFDISTRILRLSSIYPFHCELDGSTTFRISFFQIFKNNKVLKHNFVFEFNFLKAKDLGGRGFDFIERKLGSNILLSKWDEDDKSKKICTGSYFFSLLNKMAIFFSIGLEGNGIYNKLFKTTITKSGIYEFDNGFRIDITWETCVNDFRYTFYKIKKSKDDNGLPVYNIANKSKSVNCFRSFLIFLENIFILRTKLEIGFNIAKLM